MEEAKKLVMKMPGTPRGHSPSPIHLPDPTGSTIVELLKDITAETRDLRTPISTAKKPGSGNDNNGGSSGGMFLAVQSCRSTNPSPNNTAKPAERSTKETQSKTDKAPRSRDTSVERGDPSPLICQRKLGVGETPPKIFKKKAPPPTQEGQTERARSTTTEEVREFGKSVEQQKSATKKEFLDKDSLHDPKGVCQVTFTQERQPSKSEIVRKSGQDATKMIREGPKPQDAIPRPHPKEPVKQSSMEDIPKRPLGQTSGQSLTTPSAPGKPGSSSQPLPNSSTSKPSAQEHSSSTNKQPKPTVQKPSSGPKGSISQIPKLELSLATNSNNEGMCNGFSTENLIGDQSPDSMRPANRIEDVNTIKRPSKAGWL